MGSYFETCDIGDVIKGDLVNVKDEFSFPGHETKRPLRVSLYFSDFNLSLVSLFL